jgi:prepilin-type processing-associated H-X9-DG protein
MYAMDYDEQLPPLIDTAKVQAALLPYTKNRDIFASVVGGKPFHWNRLLSAKKLTDIKAPAQTVLLYDDAPHDGTRVVGFVDGHVVRMREDQSAAVVKAKAVQ